MSEGIEATHPWISPTTVTGAEMWTTLLSRMRSLGGGKVVDVVRHEHVMGCDMEASVAMTAGV